MRLQECWRESTERLGLFENDRMIPERGKERFLKLMVS
jgi:hypothetical protein